MELVSYVIGKRKKISTLYSIKQNVQEKR